MELVGSLLEVEQIVLLIQVMELLGHLHIIQQVSFQIGDVV